MAEYLSWEELDESQAASPPLDDAAEALSPELRALMEERAKLEQKFLRLIGKAPPDPQDAREKARFPMPIHTVESRLADRQRAREEERARAAARRALEAAKLRADEERERAARRRDQDRLTFQQRLLAEAEARRKRELGEQRAREALAAELVRQRWGEQRAEAVRDREERKRREWNDFEERYTRSHLRAAERRRMLLEEDLKLAERLDSRNPRRSERLEV